MAFKYAKIITYKNFRSTIMEKNKDHKLKRIWIAALLIISWSLCLITVNYPDDHVLGYNPILMYVLYSLMAIVSIASLVLILIKKPYLSDILSTASLVFYFTLSGIIFVKRLLAGYVMFLPMLTISLFILAIIASATVILLSMKRRREGYFIAIISYSFFSLSVVLESYPVVYDQVSEVYGNIKIVYFVAIITASILGIINFAQMYKEHK